MGQKGLEGGRWVKESAGSNELCASPSPTTTRTTDGDNNSNNVVVGIVGICVMGRDVWDVMCHEIEFA